MLFYSKHKTAKKIILTVFLLLFFCFFNISKTQAALWPAIDPGIQTGLTEIMNLITESLVSGIKQQSITTLISQIDNLAGQGNNGQPVFITNWEDYLINEPMNQTNIYMNDYVSQMTRGKNTYSGYSTEGFTGPANYSADLSQSVKPLSDEDVPQVTYEGDPSQMLDSGNLKNMELYLSGVNNPWAFDIAVQAEQQKVFENNKLEVQSKAIANQGFPGTETSPGILVKETMANVQDIPNKALASASSISELVSSLVSQMISRSITQGFSSVQRSISKNSSSQSRYNSSVNSAIEEDGPGARFSN